MLHASDALGGVSRIPFRMSTAFLETAAMKRPSERLGTEVAQAVASNSFLLLVLTDVRRE
jgi:hypothetical protein